MSVAQADRVALQMAVNGGESLVTRPVTAGPKHHFFGYYDKCPWNRTGRLMLALEADFLDRLPTVTDRAAVGVIDLDRVNRFDAIAETAAWTWQQGAMQQWLGGDDDRIIFNDRDERGLCAAIVDVRSRARRRLPRPVYSVHPNGRTALTLSFSRIHSIRDAYGYPGVLDEHRDEQAPAADGIHTIDLESGGTRLLVSLADLASRERVSSMAHGKHWVDHVTYNVDGSRFAFLHRWQLADGGTYHRLYVANADASDLTCLLDSGYFSHFGWRPNGELLGFGRLPSALMRLRRNAWLTRRVMKPLLPLFHRVVSERGAARRHIVPDHYLLFHADGSWRVFAAGALTEDGHCTWSPDGEWVLTDTYPDAEQRRTLMLYHDATRTRVDVGQYLAMPHRRYGVDSSWLISGMRSDLHPRWNRDGTQVCFDSVHEGNRQMYVIDVGHIVTKPQREPRG
jgi:hypothetical protein